MKKIKVLVIGLSDNYGGIEKYVYDHYSLMNHNLISFDFLSYSENHIAYYKEFKKYGSKEYMVPIFDMFFCTNRIKELLKKGKYDYVHFHVENYIWFNIMCYINKNLSSKIIVHSHNSMLDKKKYYIKLLLDSIGRWKTNKINMIRFACSKKAGDYLFKDKEYTIMRNGLYIEKYFYSLLSSNSIRRKYNIGDKEVLFGHVGNFNIAKNYPKLLSIFKEYLLLNKNAKLMLVGDYNRSSNIKRLVNKYHLNDYVIFTGSVLNVEEYYSAFDIFVFPSFYEGLSIALLESQISGLYVYASDSLDKDTIVSNKAYLFNINDDSKTIAKLIKKTYKKSNREYDKDITYLDIRKTSKILEKFYLNNL